MKSVIRRFTTLTALAATLLVGSAITSTSRALAQDYGQQSIDSDRVVAMAEPISNGRFYKLLILEQLNNQQDCFKEKPGSPTTIEPLLLNFDFSGICGRSSDSNGYSVSIGNEDLSSRYRLQVTRRGDNLVLVALPGALPGKGGDLPTLEIGRSNGVANDFVKLTLDPGWKMSHRTLSGKAQGHIYLSNDQDLQTVVAQVGGTRQPTPTPSTPSTPSPSIPSPSTPSPSAPSTGVGGSLPPILTGGSLPRPGATPTPSSGSSSSSSTRYQVIVPTDSALVRSRVQKVASDAFITTVNGRRVIQAGLFQERNRADEVVAQLSRQGIETQVIESQRATPSPSPTPSPRPTPSPIPTPSPSPTATSNGQRFYQVIVPESGSDTRARVNAIESGAFRTQVNGQSVIQAGRFSERDRAEQLQRRLSDARLPAQIIDGSAPVASVPRSPSPSPSIPQARQGQLTVVLDPGHGGGDPGAVGVGGLREKDVNLAISEKVKANLEAKGINVVMARASDVEIDLDPRVNTAERVKADIFVSIHANSISLSRPDVNGLETYYYSSGQRLAQTIHNSVLQQTDMLDRGVRTARFYVLVNSSMPAVLVETGFVTGRDDAARFRNPATRDQIANGISNGILQYLNVQ